MNIYLLLFLFFAYSSEFQPNPIVWFDFNNNGLLSNTVDKSRVYNKIFLGSINNNDHRISLGYTRIKNYLKSINNIEKIKKSILQTGEITIKISLKSNKIGNDLFCLFCIIGDEKEFSNLNEIVKDCSHINFGILIVRNMIMIINRDTHSTDCKDSSIQTTFMPENKQIFLFQMNKDYKRLYINNKLVIEKITPNNRKDISNWNDSYKIFIGKNGNSNSFVDMIDLLIWNNIMSFSAVNSFDQHVPTFHLKKSIEEIPKKNVLTRYYEQQENNNYILSNWMSTDKDILTYKEGTQEEVYVKKSSCSIDYHHVTGYSVKTYYIKEKMKIQLQILGNGKLVEKTLYNKTSSEKYILSKKTNIRFIRKKYNIQWKQQLIIDEPIQFQISLFSRQTKELLFNYPCSIFTSKFYENENQVIISAADSVKKMEIKVSVTDLFIKYDELYIDFNTRFSNHFNRDIFLGNETIVDSAGFPMGIYLLSREKENQKWRMKTTERATKNIKKKQHSFLYIFYFTLSEIGLIVKMQANVLINDFNKIKRIKNIYGGERRRKFGKKEDKKKNLSIVESFYLDKELTKPIQNLYYNQPIYMTISIIDKTTNTSHEQCSDKSLVLHVDKITLEVEKNNGIHHYDITNSIHKYNHDIYKKRGVCLSSVILSFQLSKYHLDGSLNKPFFQIGWRFLDDSSVVAMLPKEKDPNVMDELFEKEEKNHFYKTSRIDVRCCPFLECGVPNRCLLEQNKEFIGVVILFTVLFVVLVFFIHWVYQFITDNKEKKESVSKSLGTPTVVCGDIDDIVYKKNKKFY